MIADAAIGFAVIIGVGVTAAAAHDLAAWLVARLR